MGRQTGAMLLAALGRALIVAGSVVLLFAAYQLWGTGISESRAQNDLAERFTRELAAAPATTTAPPGPPISSTPTTATITTAPRAVPTPEQIAALADSDPGDPVARIVIPRIGVDKIVVEGVTDENLRAGPGHFPGTAFPGLSGNAAIAGHRTTYGAPFGDLDRLAPGDRIVVTTRLGEAVYLVAGTRIVTPDQIEVIDDFGDDRLTLSACHPKYSAAQRIVVWALLEGPSFDAPSAPRDAATTAPGVDSSRTTAETTVATETTEAAGPRAGDQGLPAAPETAPTPLDASSTDTAFSGDAGAWPGAIAWGLATVGLAAASAFGSRRLGNRVLARRIPLRWLGHAAATPPVLGCLFVTFTYVDRLLPAL